MKRLDLRMLFALLFAVSGPARGAETFLDLSMEELSRVKVTSVSKREESLLSAPSAVYVLTQADIRRSGVTRIVDALRLVPGVQVFQTNAYTWAVGARGFASQGLSNKMLVLVDGRSVYSPLYSGVFWDHHDYPIHTIDRIEVIRGPGATLYGANAVNGVINIITKAASQTHGMIAEAYYGGAEQGGEFVAGGALGEAIDYRVAGSIQNIPSYTGNIADENTGGHATARVDADLGDGLSLTNHTDVFLQETDETGTRVLTTAPFSATERSDLQSIGVSDTLRLSKRIAEDRSASVQLYYDYNHYEYIPFTETRHTADLDGQYDFALLNEVADRRWYERRHDLTIGADVQVSADEFSHDLAPLRGGSLDPSSQTFWKGGAFVQDRVTVLEDLLQVTVGTKLGGNEWSGFEVQPSGRFSFTPHEQHAFWGAVSRAVRTPTRFEHESDLPLAFLPAGAPPLFGTGLNPAFPSYYVLGGNTGMKSEELLAFELGYRADLLEDLRLDVAAFYDQYDRLLFVGVDPVTLQSTDGITYNYVPLVINNDLKGDTHGFEVALWYHPLDWWSLNGSYSYLEVDLEPRTGVDPAFAATAEDGEQQEPQNAFILQSHLTAPLDFELGIVRARDFSLDTALRYVDDIPFSAVDEYYGLDSRLAWRPMPELELAVAGRNLITGHRESKAANATRIPRVVLGMVTLRFGRN